MDPDATGTNIVPALADRWSASPDAMTWTLHLRSDIRFHDGASLDSAAVALSLRRTAAARPEAGGIIASIGAPDATTVTVALRSPYAPFLAMLSSTPFAIVSPACLGAAAPSPCASGTGPFRADAASFRAGTRVLLRRNDTYWRRDAAGRRLPYLDALTYEAIKDEAARLAALKAASIDVAFDVGPTAVRGVRADPNVAALVRPPFGVSFLAFGSARPFDRLDVRRAVALAIDRTAIIQTVGGEGSAAAQLIPPGMLGFDDTVMRFGPSDASAAKKALSDAGLAGASVDLWFPSDGASGLSDPRRVAEAIAADLTRAGFSVTTRAGNATAAPSQVRSSEHTLWLGSRASSYSDPDGFFDDLPVSGVAQELLRKARGEADPSKRAELYKQVSKLIQQDVTVVPLLYPSVFVAASRRILGFTARPVGDDVFSDVWVEKGR